MTKDQVLIGAESKEYSETGTKPPPTWADLNLPDSIFRDLSSIQFNLQGVFLPTPNTDIPVENIFESWETAFYQYILLSASEFLALLESLPQTNEGEDFFNIDWEKLFDIPINPSLDSLNIVTIGQTAGFVGSLSIVSFSSEESLLESRNDFVQSVVQTLQLTGTSIETPKILLPFIPSPTEPIPVTPSFFPDPNYFFTTTTLPGGVAQQLTNFLTLGIPSELNQIYLNTYSAIQLHGNLFSTQFNGDPDGAYVVGASLGDANASLSALNIVGGSVIHTANSVILTTAVGNTLELFTAGAREGEFVYTLNNAVNPFADFASLPSLGTFFGPVVFTLDQFIYSVQNSFGNVNIGSLFFPVLNDVPVAHNEGYDPSFLVTVNEAQIASIGSAQTLLPELVAGSLITPFVSNGILVISPDSTLIPVTPDTAIQVNPTANGSYFGANDGFVSAVSLNGVTNATPVSTFSTTMTTFSLSDVLYLQSQGFTVANGYKLSTIVDPVIAIQDSLGNTLLVDTITSQYIYKLNASFEHTSPNAILPGMHDPAIVNFNFTLTDNQGQSASAQLGITVSDDAPVVNSASGTVYESGLPNGSGTVPTTTVLTGDFGVFGADGFDATNPISISLATIGATATAEGLLFSGPLTTQFISIGTDPGISVTDSTDGNSLVINLNNLNYTYTLSSPLLFTSPIATQTYSLTFTDTDGSTANATFVVTINDDPPVLDNAGSTVIYVSGATTGTLLEGGITLSDTFPTLGHNATNGAVISITDFFNGDKLNFDTQNGITGIYNDLTGVLSLSGIASIEDYEAALRSITYSSSNPNPANAGTDFTRTITWTAFDSANVSSNVETTTINIIGLPPEISNVGNTVTYVALEAPVIIESGITITSIDYEMLQGATVSITSGLFAGDLLTFTGQNGITGDYNSGLGVLTLTGTANFTDYQAVLASVAYSSSSTDPTNDGANLSRTITWIADDGQVTNNLSTPVTSFIEVRTPPVITAGNTITYFAGDSPQLIESALMITAHESQTITEAVVTISSFYTGDILAFDFTSFPSFIWTYDSGVLTLSGGADVADYQGALRTVTYESSNSDPTNGGANLSRTISWEVTDNLNVSSNVATSTVEVRTPPLISAGDTITYIATDSPQVIDSTLTITAFESQTIIGAIVTINSADFDPNDILAFTPISSITGIYDSGVLTLSGTDSVANYILALQSVTYESSSSDPTNGGTDLSRDISWQVTDDLNVSNSVVATSTIDVRTPPTLVVPDFDNYIHGNNTPSELSGLVTITSLESADLTGAMISISTGFLTGDELHFTDQNGITGTYDGINGILTLTGDSAVSNYETALSSITYSFSGTDPTNGGADPNRIFSWTLTDDLSQTNDPPATNSIAVSLTPIVLDLSGAGINLVSATDSHQTLGAVIGTDHTQAIGWITQGEGILMLNSNGDGTITNSHQISFTSYVPGALSDLQGLTAFDSNHDGKLDAADAAFKEFGVLLANSHFETLTQLGITSISLSSDNQFQTMNGNTIFGMTSYQTTDGKTHQAADVGFMIGNPMESPLKTSDIFPSQDHIDFTKLPALPSAPSAPTAETTTTIAHTDANVASISATVNTQTIQSTTEQVMPHPEPHPV